jgi:hypothetical protein
MIDATIFEHRLLGAALVPAAFELVSQSPESAHSEPSAAWWRQSTDRLLCTSRTFVLSRFDGMPELLKRDAVLSALHFVCSKIHEAECVSCESANDAEAHALIAEFLLRRRWPFLFLSLGPRGEAKGFAIRSSNATELRLRCDSSGLWEWTRFWHGGQPTAGEKTLPQLKEGSKGCSLFLRSRSNRTPNLDAVINEAGG